MFGRPLINEEGDIPKVFRTGLFRKDSVDSFSQLMSDIVDLDNENEGNMNKNMNREDMDENERIAKRID